MVFDIHFIFYVLITLIIGSALTSITWRWRLWAQHQWHKEANEFLGLPVSNSTPVYKYSSGRSVCRSCKHTLTSTDLIPLVSFAFLKGRCRYCGQRIGARYFIIELFSVIALTPLYFITSSMYELIVMTFMISTLLCAMIIDAEDFWLPDECHFLVALSATVLFLHSDYDFVLQHISAAFFAYVFIYLLRALFLRLKKVEGIGLGDAKLLAVLVYWQGALSFTTILLTASILGIVGALMRGKRYREQLAFGPYLIAAALIYFYLGEFL